MKIQSSSNKALDTIVDKIYNLVFGWLDSLFDDAYYEKTEEKIPKDKVEKPEDVVDDKGHKVDMEDVEVAGDAKVVKFVPKSEPEETETSEELTEEAAEDAFTVKIVPLEKEGFPEFVGITVTNETTGKSSKSVAVPKDNKSAIQQVIEQGKKEVSATIKVALTKVTGSSGCALKLKNITASYNLPAACNDAMCLISDDEFISSIPEGDSTYRIDVYQDGYDVNELSDCKFQTSVYADTLDCSIKAFARIQELCWFAKGIDYNNFKSICDTLTYHLQYQTTELAKLCIINNVEPTFLASSSDAKDVIDKWQSLKDCVAGYIAMLEVLCLACSIDEQTMLRNWIRELNDVILYQLKCLSPEIGTL